MASDVCYDQALEDAAEGGVASDTCIMPGPLRMQPKSEGDDDVQARVGNAGLGDTTWNRRRLRVPLCRPPRSTGEQAVVQGAPLPVLILQLVSGWEESLLQSTRDGL